MTDAREKREALAKRVYDAMLWAYQYGTGNVGPKWQGGNSVAENQARIATYDILAALPDMVPDLVWEDHPMGSSCRTDNDYSINYWEREGLFVDAYTTMRRHRTLEAAKAAANAHHRATWLATLTGGAT